ncbi:MAG: acetyl-CoA carboxylase biotin carboxyl carrier protein [Candidatus Hydrothermia bacterium]|jgi:acetyl-CoA carboxylase biotin carboxyl carrier protein|nr:acetyl-CoA carboxylase biotin carboxyl carrier protein [Candidatus Hydrothermia bacterium]
MKFEDILKIIEIFEKSNLTELEIKIDEPKFKIKLSKNNQIQNQVIQIPQIPQIQNFQPIQKEEVIKEVKEEKKENIHIIKSPLVGTFYRAPSPGAEPFVKEGDFVKKGQVLCIIEAMKVMNEIESDVDGIVERILVENGKPVEYGQELFIIRLSS